MDRILRDLSIALFAGFASQGFPEDEDDYVYVSQEKIDSYFKFFVNVFVTKKKYHEKKYYELSISERRNYAAYWTYRCKDSSDVDKTIERLINGYGKHGDSVVVTTTLPEDNPFKHLISIARQ